MACPRLIRGRIDSQGAWLALCLTIATVPVVVLGAVLKISGLAEALRSVTVIGWAMLLFGGLLYYMDQRAMQARGMDRLGLKDSLMLGLWQAVALIPGTSRSGIVITGALHRGFTRTEAARIAMLMSIPTILASGLLSSLDLIGGAVAFARCLYRRGGQLYCGLMRPWGDDAGFADCQLYPLCGLSG